MKEYLIKKKKKKGKKEKKAQKNTYNNLVVSKLVNTCSVLQKYKKIYKALI